MSRDAGKPFERLVETMRTLRSEAGCPWDREQTLESLRPFLLEETYEVLDAIDRGDMDDLKGEIGDLLFEAVFLAQIASEAAHFDIVDSTVAIVNKLVGRHPHVFGEGRAVLTSRQVVERWETLKARERKTAGEREGLLRGIPQTMPALLRAHEIGTRVSAVGFDWPAARDIVHKMEEEVDEIGRALDEPPTRVEEEIGDLLFTLANLARKLGVEPESALRRASDKFTKRFESMEEGFRARGMDLGNVSAEQLEEEWNKAKAEHL
jgi:MazG family protein